MDTCETKQRRRPAGNHRPHIGIVGGGFSGLRCADVLLRCGFRVTVIEGRDRLGGRVHQQRIPADLDDEGRDAQAGDADNIDDARAAEGNTESESIASVSGGTATADRGGPLADLGPNWIHGTSDNPILDLAHRTDTALRSWTEEASVFDEAGRLMFPEEGEAVLDMMWSTVEEGFAYSKQHTASIGPEESLYDFFSDQVKRKIPASEPDCEEKRRIALQLSDFWGAYVGSPVTKQSLKFLWMEECIERENIFCAGTYSEILEAISGPVVEGADVRYQCVATKIKYGTAEKGAVTVETAAGGEAFEFDAVVVTSPLGWLKRHVDDAFEPRLPDRLARAIRAVGYGSLEKVYVSFRKAFWAEPDADGRFVQGFIQWLRPNYAPESNSERWYQDAVELASLPGSAAHPTVLFYLYGDQSSHLTDATLNMSAAEKQHYLWNFFRPYIARLPNYSETSPACRPTGCLATDWLHDELAGNGSYSNFQVGLGAGDDDVGAMREGVPDAGLWFAGEHTAPFAAMGTVTGAYCSGESVARRIAEAYGRGVDEGGQDSTS